MLNIFKKKTQEDLDKDLIHAIDHRNLGKVKKAIKKGANPNFKNDALRSIFHYAVLKDDAEIVDYIAKNGADVNTADILGETPLISASKIWKSTTHKALINNGAILDTQDNEGRTAIMHSIMSGDLTNVDILLEAGARYHDIADNDGKTALDFANDCPCKGILERLKKQAKIDNVKIETAETIKAKTVLGPIKEAIFQMDPNDIMAQKNAPTLQKIINKGLLGEVFEGLDYKRQNALLVACWDHISADDELNQKIQQAMQESLNKEQGVKIDIEQIKLLNLLNIAKVNG